MTNNTATATRTWNGDKATILLTLPDGTTKKVGGARCARAEAVIVFKWEDTQSGCRGLEISVRSDLAAAMLQSASNARHPFAIYSQMIAVTDNA